MRYNQAYTNLSAVTTATTGSTIGIANCEAVTAQVNVTVNTGAVTVTIEASIDGTNWVTLSAVTHTATTGNYAYNYALMPYKYIRSKTTTQSTSTVSVLIYTIAGLGQR